MATRFESPTSWKQWKALLVADLEHVALRDRWGRALMAIGWIHLAFFLSCQAFYRPDGSRALISLGLWAGEFAAVLAALRLIAGRGWYRSTPLAGLIARIWGTFLIVSFNVASLNTQMGWALDWFKPVWTTLSIFGLMMMAYLINGRYFFLAAWMFFTGLIMVRLPAYNYAIYGLSWWAALQVVGSILERRRAVLFAGADGVAGTAVPVRPPILSALAELSAGQETAA